ncbi:MAG: hypothetical protein OEV36_11905, partial [Myxococcales bacterium]|nr:hypothetical protein [Myxococcales bacterium]
MRRIRTALLLVPILAPACAGNPDRYTLARLRDVQPDLTEVRVENSLDQAMAAYRNFLAETPESSLTPEAMRRLADLKLEKQYGILGNGVLIDLAAPEKIPAAGKRQTAASERSRAATGADPSESEEDFERRAADAREFAASDEATDLELPGGEELAGS